LETASTKLIVVPLPTTAARRRVSPDVDPEPCDRDLAVVYSPLMPVPFRERLLALGYALVEVSDDEFDTMGAKRPGLARAGADGGRNPKTRAALERARGRGAGLRTAPRSRSRVAAAPPA